MNCFFIVSFCWAAQKNANKKIIIKKIALSFSRQRRKSAKKKIVVKCTKKCYQKRKILPTLVFLLHFFLLSHFLSIFLLSLDGVFFLSCPSPADIRRRLKKYTQNETAWKLRKFLMFCKKKGWEAAART